MSTEMFIRLFNMSLTGSVVILAVLVLRLFLRRAPKLISCCLWAVVLFRLLCPVSFSLPVSLLQAIDAPMTEQGTVDYIPENIRHSATPAVDLPVPDQINDAINETLPQGIENMAGALDGPTAFAHMVWGLGVILMLLYSVISLCMLEFKLVQNGRVEQIGDNMGNGLWRRYKIYYYQGLSTAFVMGIVRPRIFLPEGLTEEEKKYVLLHEEIHIRRKDHLVKIISWITLCIHWFNPLVWAAFFLSGRDMEMSCDEAVLRKLGNDKKKEYSATLLNLAAGRRILGGVPLAFGEGDTGSRIRNVLRYKKTALGLVLVTAAATAVAAIFLLANPMEGYSMASDMVYGDDWEDEAASDADISQPKKDEKPERTPSATAVPIEESDVKQRIQQEALEEAVRLQAMERGQKLTRDVILKPTKAKLKVVRD